MQILGSWDDCLFGGKKKPITELDILKQQKVQINQSNVNIKILKELDGVNIYDLTVEKAKLSK